MIFKNIIFTIFLLSLIFPKEGSPQVNIKNYSNSYSGWTTSNPFHTDVFIENLGQFNDWAKTTSAIKYAVNNSDKIFFTQQGITFKLEKIGEEIEPEEEKENKYKSEIFFVNMFWEGSNPNSIIEVNEQKEGYYTFAEQKNENIKAKGYKKLIYKNLYPQIDVEYTIPNKGGIKYQLILHPGADLSRVKMHYTGAIEEIKIDNEGNTLIKTPAGNITDYAPKSFYEEDNTAVPSAFEIKGNTISFKLRTKSSQPKTIIIDPWTITPTSLTTDNSAYDINSDDEGNVYVSGGEAPFKLSKYSNTGNLLWTYTTFPNWGIGKEGRTYSRFCIIPQTGTTFIGEGINGNGPRIVKIASSGILKTIANDTLTNEIWTMFYNRCNGQLVGFGGGTRNNNNTVIFSDTNLTSYSVKNFNGSSSSGFSNDVAAAEMDNNGDFYALMASKVNSSANRLQKSLLANNYGPPCAWDVNSGYLLDEAQSMYLTTSLLSNRSNSLALNNQSLFSYDGKTLKAWNKSNGSLLSSVVVNNTYWGGKDKTHDGIAVDECNNVYVGGFKMVHVYSFDTITKTFIFQTNITTNIPDQVYDVRLDRATGTLYICGFGFVTVTQVASCDVYTLTSMDSINDCLGYAGINNVSGGTPPYTYKWSNGESTNSISGVPGGIYTVLISDNSCITHKKIDTLQVLPALDLGNDTAFCDVPSFTLDAGSTGKSFLWSTGANTQTITVNNTGNYWVEVDRASCIAIDTINLSFNTTPIVDLGEDLLLCLGETKTLDAGNQGADYLWSTGAISRELLVENEGMYWVNVNNYLCKSSDSVTISFKDCEVLIEMPNVFTPNGDGGNDKYLPVVYKGVKEAKIQIYNRWGHLVKSGELLDGWDGLNHDDGTYYYVVNATGLNGESFFRKGFFLLISKK